MLLWLSNLSDTERWIIGLLAVFIGGVFVQWFSQRLAHALADHREAETIKRSAKKRFTDSLLPDISALLDQRNSGKDALAVLEPRFEIHRLEFEAIRAHKIINWLCRRKFERAWIDYYGEDEPEEETAKDWYRCLEYSTLLSNKLSNTTESTKQLAIDRLRRLINLCT